MEVKPIIGWIGTGVMGLSMCKHILQAGYPTYVYNRTKSKADSLLESGAQWKQPHQICSTAQIIFLMLGYPKDIEDLCFGQNSIIKHIAKGKILVDHTTSKPSLAKKIYQVCKSNGINSVDAPVSGGDVGAKKGTLVTMCGGDKEIVQQIQPILKCYSSSVRFAGEAGMGQHTKMANQIVLAGNMIGMVEGLMYASKMGLGIQQTIQTICSGAANSTALSVMGPRIMQGNYDPGFYVQHYIKDMQIALQECSRMQLSMPGLSLVKQFYTSLKAHGGGRLGTQALIKVYENMNNWKVNKE